MTMLYALGSNGSGQLAIGHQEDVSVPKEVCIDTTAPLHSITQVKAGGNHTLLLAAGKLYGAGDSSSGACGMAGSATPESIFHEIILSDDPAICNFPVVICAASWEASIIVQQDENGCSNKLSTFGTGNHGELGQGEFIFRSAKAQLVMGFPPEKLEIRDVVACVNHVVTVLSNGDVYGWGNGRKGQLGEPKGFFYKPRKISGLDFKVIRAVCGREFTCLLGRPETGSFHILGSDKGDVITSAPKTLYGWTDVNAGWSSIHVLDQDGILRSWGQNNFGQLAPSGLPRLSKIAIGSEHALGLTKDGNILAWGWGEHGNCGPVKSDGKIKDRWNVIASSQYLASGHKLVGIGAGCATSWIFVETS